MSLGIVLEALSPMFDPSVEGLKLGSGFWELKTLILQTLTLPRWESLLSSDISRWRMAPDPYRQVNKNFIALGCLFPNRPNLGIFHTVISLTLYQHRLTAGRCCDTLGVTAVLTTYILKLSDPAAALGS